MNVLFIDNYDSFSYNLVDELRSRGAHVDVWRNRITAGDAIEIAESMPQPRLIVLSPGPGAPREAGCCIELVRMACARVPLFGVCLGLQAITEAFGGVVASAGEIVHGKSALVTHDGYGLLDGIPSPFRAARYHSLAATSLPDDLLVTATTGSTVMAIEHRTFPLAGVQFHPESILTPTGGAVIDNLFRWAARHDQPAR